MSEILNWVADAVLILLLGGTLVMAVRLDRALRTVGGDRAAFEALISSLSNATNAVKHGIQALRAEADRAADQIERRSEDADKMATDLSFLIEAADRAGTRLEQHLSSAPKASPEKTPAATASRQLRIGRKYVRRETACPEVQTPVAPLPPEPLPAPPPPTSIAPPAAVCFANDTPAALRQMAGITTRRRAMEPVDAVPLEQPDQDTAARSRLHDDDSHLGSAQMKRVG